MWYCTLNKIVTCLWWQSSGCVGCSVVLLDWTVYWSWRVWGKGFIPLLICIFQLCFNHCLSRLETCTSSIGQPCPSFSDGSFLRVARGNCLSCVFGLVSLTIETRGIWFDIIGFCRSSNLLDMNHIQDSRQMVNADIKQRHDKKQKEKFLAWTRYLQMCCYRSLQKKQKENDLNYTDTL